MILNTTLYLQTVNSWATKIIKTRSELSKCKNFCTLSPDKNNTFEAKSIARKNNKRNKTVLWSNRFEFRVIGTVHGETYK